MADEKSADLFGDMLEGTRIFIKDGRVTFENLTPEMLDVATSLNPDNAEIRQREDMILRDKCGSDR